MSGRAATVNIIAGKHALSVGRADMPCPPGWKWVALGDVARLESGHTPSREHPEYWDGDIPWIGIKDARTHHGRVISTTFQTVTQAGIDNSAARLLPAGTVCLSRTASVGYVVVTGRVMATSQDFVNWVCGPALDPHFLKQLFIAENESLFRFGKGSTHTTIYYPEVKAFHVCVPPLDEQRRIVAKLEALQARSRRARKALDAVPPLLEKLRQSILAAAFRGDLTKDWRAKHPDVEPASKLLERIRAERRKKWEEAELAKMTAKGKPPTDDRWRAKYKEPEPVDATKFPKLPVGWCWVSVEELTNNFDGDRIPLKEADRHKRSGPYAYYGASGVIDDIDDFIFDGSYLLIAEDGANLVSRSTAIAFEATGRFWVNNHAHVMQTVLVPQSYLRHYVNGIRLEPWVSGTAQPKLTQKNLNRIPVPLCPSEEQHVVLATLDAALDRSRRLDVFAENVETKLRSFDSTILLSAFRGELVPQDPNEETAALTLARPPETNGAGKDRDNAASKNPTQVSRRSRGTRTSEA